MWVRSIAFAFSLLFSGQASADAGEREAASEPLESAVAGLAASCSGCHTRAVTDDAFPRIYDRPAEIREKMLAFRSGKRQGTVMNRIARGYSDEEIELLAGYLAKQDDPD
jgi:cytochrome subunit of sulfide dehydrogenase